MSQSETQAMSSKGSDQANSLTANNPEVVPGAKRRRFSSTYKLRILREAAGCSEYGQVGALLRREGLYSSHLTDWRRQQTAGQLSGSAERKRGRQAQQTKQERENVKLRQENEQLKQRLGQAELIIDAQKKLARLLAQRASQVSGGKS